MGVTSLFIADRQSEDLFLDFKQSHDDARTGKLSNQDRNNFSKAVSGFGNSEGGVIVWGVDCRSIDDSGDVVTGHKPITNPRRFRSYLEGVLSGVTVPPHQGVEHHVIEREDGKGYIISLIRKSNDAPLQAIYNKRYCVRAGSSFMPTPHDVLAGLFGRRPNPHVMHQFLSGGARLEEGRLAMEIGLMLLNTGPGIAIDVFTNCMIWEKPGDNSDVGVDFNDGNFSCYAQFGIGWNLICLPDFRMPPDLRVQPIVFSIYLKPPFEKGLKITGKVGAANSRSYNWELSCTTEELTSHYDRLSKELLKTIRDDKKLAQLRYEFHKLLSE